MKLWMLGPRRSCLDNLFSQVREKRKGTCVGTGFFDTELLLGVLVSYMFPYTLSYNFLGSILSDQSLLPELRPDVGEAAVDTELCGLDRAGRQTQRAKCSGPFKMSRQEARLGKKKKQRHSPHTRAQTAYATAPRAQRMGPLGSKYQFTAHFLRIRGCTVTGLSGSEIVPTETDTSLPVVGLGESGPE